MDLVYEFLVNKIKLNKDSKIVIGVSTGPDSMCLLNILLNLQEKLKFKIIVAHVNHKKRVESDEEEQFLEDYCFKKNLVFEKMILDNKYKGNFEAYARKERYKFFEELINKHQANILMTAHHGDDLVETILMKLTRGSNLKGYQGISLITKKNNYQIIRPLLYVTKDDINKYLCDNNIPFFIDKTNNCDDYTRNRYRHHVLNFLKSENRDVHLKFLKFENRLEEANNYIEKNTLIAYNNCYRDGSLNINLFLENDLFIRRLIIEKIFSNLYEDLSFLTDKHVDLVINLINESKSNIEIDLPKGIRVIKEYGLVKFKNTKKEIKNYKIELKNGLILENGMQFIIYNGDSNGNDTMHINSKDVSLPLYVRNRKPGDVIALKGNGHKKVKDIFIDCKIEKDERDSYPIVVDSKDEIIWIPKLKKSKYDVQNRENCDIIFKCL